MSETVLTVLKFCFLALLYLFLWRVVRVTVRELRAPAPAGVPAAAGRPAPRRGKRADGRGGFRLRIIEPRERRGETFGVDREVTVGRGGGCGIVLADDTYVSQVHARVYQQDGNAFVEDLGSTNGTYVNGKRIKGSTRLRRGDRVQFGQTAAEVVK